MISTRRAATEPRLRRAALATALVFATNGFLLGSWVARLPATRDRLGASAAELGASVHSHADAISAHVGAIGEEAAELAAAARGTVRIGGIEPLAHLDLVPLLAGLLGLGNSFRMLRLPDQKPSSSLDGMDFG